MSIDQTVKALESIENHQVEVLMKKIWDLKPTTIQIRGFGIESGMLRFLQRLTEKALKRITNFNYIIHLHSPSLFEGIDEDKIDDVDNSTIISYRVVKVVAAALNLMDEDNSKIKKLKTELEEEAYYTYNPINEQKELELIKQMKTEIYQTLRGKKYLLVTEEMNEQFFGQIAMQLLFEGWLPGFRFGSNIQWNDSCSLLITLDSESIDFGPVKQQIPLFDLSDLMDHHEVFSPMFIVEQELYLAAKSISSKYCMELRRSMDILWSCLQYTTVIYSCSKRLRLPESKELIQMWIAEVLLSADVKFRHVESASLPKELNALTSLEEDGGEGSKKEEDIFTNDQQFSQLFGLADIILEALTSSSLFRPLLIEQIKNNKYSFGIWKLLLKWNELQEKYADLNHWWSDRWGFIKTYNFTDIISDSNKVIKKTRISIHMDQSQKFRASWMLHPKHNNTTTFYLKVDDFPDDPPLEPIAKFLCTLSYLRVLKLEGMKTGYFIPKSLSSLKNLRLLSIHSCDIRSLGSGSSSVPSPIGSMEKLEVLDLVGLPYLTGIPDDLGKKKHQLYYLRISDHNITSLPSNLFNDMPNLRELVLNGSNSKSLTSLSPLVSLTNLEIISLSNTKLVSLPPDTFEKMQHLRVLKLINNVLLETLPKSLSNAEMLEEIELRDCSALRAIDSLPMRNLKVFIFYGHNDWIQSWPESLARSYKLQEVKISGFSSLKEIKINGNKSIRSFSLSDSSITLLSLCGCGELANIDLEELEELENLNLSGTAITEIPDVSEFPRLRKLDLLAVPHLRRVPWHKLDHIPKIFNLDQCDFINGSVSDFDSEYWKTNQGMTEIMDRVCIRVTNSHLFLSLSSKHCTHLFNKGSLPTFYVLLASSEKRKEALGTSLSQTMQFQPFEQSCYKDAKLKALAPKSLLVQQTQCSRHVKISSTERYPFGLEGILEITESLSVEDNIHISSVSDMNPRLPVLRTLQIKECYKIKSLFNATSEESVCSKLQNISVTCLPYMSHLVIEKGSYLLGESFGSLKNLHLSQCQRLKSIFPDDVLLPNLEMLVITSCSSLQTVFYKSGYYTFDADTIKNFRENHLRSLHTIRLYLLPQLVLIHEEQRVGALLMPKWRTFFFRGCWGLFQLPLLNGSCGQKVSVDGEGKKCNTLKALMDTEQLSHYEFRPKPPVASTKDTVKNMMFLK
ncbi:TIR-NBS-LRR class disease resistance protein [Rhynchospora pubera]|uniref:TIR-NBS-LRR class disease resistance protein n=1 Tax=Rhynchospora pubera TaxID=906938 RepID=A0AAV8GEA1_9POAL|nr:TIR-NBS-LRR class disease resistance protein [Rhynchospora pubera]